MAVLGKILVWMEERFGRFLLPIEFDRQEPPHRGHAVKLHTAVNITERPGLA